MKHLFRNAYATALQNRWQIFPIFTAVKCFSVDTLFVWNPA